MMRRALQYQRLCGGTIALHEEDPELSGDGVMHEGAGLGRARPGRHPLGLGVDDDRPRRRARRLRGRPDPRPAPLRRRVGRGGRAPPRRPACRSAAEATPHHLCLTDEEVRSLDPRRFKMNPPLRTEADRQALIEGLRDGTIDCIATDHAPHATEEKEVPFEQAAMGVTGLETAFAALHTDLVLPGTIDLGAAGRAAGRRRRAVRPRAPDPGAGQRGQHRPLRPRRRVDGRRGRLREPLAQLLVRRPHADRPGADDRRRRPGRLPAAQPSSLGGRRVSAERLRRCSRTAPASTATLCGAPRSRSPARSSSTPR